MEISINSQKKTFSPAPTSLLALMELEYPDHSQSIAVAVNNRVIPKDQWKTCSLKPQDQVLVISPTQGG